MTSSVLSAERFETVTRSEIAATHCNSEWVSLLALQPNAWTGFGAVEIDNAIDIATTEAFNKYAAAIPAYADYVATFVGFADTSNHNATYLALARAKYDLGICLTPTKSERSLITELALTTGDKSERDVRATLFQTFDQFDCMQFAKASEVIFDLAPPSQPFFIDFEAITEANMTVCE